MRLLLAALLMCCVASFAEAQTLHTITSVDVRDNGLYASYHRPVLSRLVPGVVVLGGSEGGIEGAESLARPLAEQGYATLAVALFGAESLPANLQDVPLDYFDRAIDWLPPAPMSTRATSPSWAHREAPKPRSWSRHAAPTWPP